MKNKPLKIALIAVLSLSVVFVSVFGIVFAVRRKNAFAYYESTSIDEGVYRYICYEMQTNIVRQTILNELYYPETLSELEELPTDDGGTYADLYRDMIKTRVETLLVCARLFDYYGYEVDEEVIEETISSYVTYKSTGGTEKSTEEALAPLGITLKDLKKVATLYYKEQNVEKELYGQNGEKLKNNADTAADCADFCAENYHGVKLLFIRTENRFATDENGNVDTTADPVGLTTDERVERETAIKNLDAAIAGGTLTAEMMNGYAADFKNDGNVTDAYYFYENASYTKEMKEGLPDVITASLEVKPGEARKTAYKDSDGDFVGYCYIFGLVTPNDAYATASNTACFSDFYALCADALFTEALQTLMPDVVFTEKCRAFDVFSVPYDPDDWGSYRLQLS